MENEDGIHPGGMAGMIMGETVEPLAPGTRRFAVTFMVKPEATREQRQTLQERDADVPFLDAGTNRYHVVLPTQEALDSYVAFLKQSDIVDQNEFDFGYQNDASLQI